jgi:hypothetical protein
MEDRETQTTPNELEIAQMIRIDARSRVDLEGVVIMRRILKQTVTWVKNLMGEEEEPLSVGRAKTSH